MKAVLSVVCASAVLAGCAINGDAPATAWGKRDVSMFNYRADAGQCAIKAAMSSTRENGAYTAGGVSGRNGVSVSGAGASGSSGPPGGPAPSDGGPPKVVIGEGTASSTIYGDHASSDFADRAATQQKAQEMTDQRARDGVLKSCLSDRGYTQFSLNAEQRAALEKLPGGTDARREYLYKLGTDPEVLAAQSLAK